MDCSLTPRRIICILFSALLFLGASLPQITAADSLPIRRSIPVRRSNVIVSLGDSFASGEGIEEFYYQDKVLSEKMTQQDWLAHRSQNSWSGMLTLPGVDGPMSAYKDDHWFFAASSGATTKHIKYNTTEKPSKNASKKEADDLGFQRKDVNRDGVKYHAYIDPQLNVFDTLKQQGKSADYVTISIGGNDAEFVGLVMQAAKTGVPQYYLPNYPWKVLTQKIKTIWANFYKPDGIRSDLKKTYSLISEIAGRQATILVTGYPKIFEAELAFSHWLFQPNVEIYINYNVHKFNDQISRLVEECREQDGLNIQFIDIEAAFQQEYRRHAIPKSLLNNIIFEHQSEDLDTSTLTSSYSVHPNLEGAKVYAASVQAAINELEKQRIDRKTIAAGDFHAVGLKTDGSVVACGRNEDGQCNLSGWKDIVSVAAGGCHTVGLKADGTVVAAGLNEDGQCNVSDWKDIVSIAAGGSLTVGLKADGSVVACGNNEYGQCNVSDWSTIVSVATGGIHTVGLKADGTVVAAGYNSESQCNVAGWKDIVSIAAGSFHTVGLKADGTVIATGSNEDGLCNVSDWDGIVSVSAGWLHMAGLKVDGTVVATGRNEEGQTDIYDWKDIVSVAAGGFHTVGLKADGTVVLAGRWFEGQREISDWKGISGGDSSLVAMAATNSSANVPDTAAQNSSDVGSGWNQGNSILFGAFEQDDCALNGPEPIEWLILDQSEDRILVISRYALNCLPYHTYDEATSWENCTLRQWLNGSFYTNAFSEAERRSIICSDVTSEANLEYGTPAGNNTEDYVFLLSSAEVKQYFTSDSAGACQMTEYAFANGGHLEDDWYLRTPGIRLDHAALISKWGTVDYYGESCQFTNLVRPAMWLDAHTLVTRAVEEVSFSQRYEQIKKASVGDSVLFGHYDSDTISLNGLEEIEWIVLEKKADRILVLSKYGLDCEPYDERGTVVPWENSGLREWLNKSFFFSAFSDEEKSVIPLSSVTADPSPIIGKDNDPGSDTEDYVFPLSLSEVENYFPQNDERLCQMTVRACKKNADHVTGRYVNWWLRTPGARGFLVACVDTYGNIIDGGFGINEETVVVRPAMWILTGDMENDHNSGTVAPDLLIKEGGFHTTDDGFIGFFADGNGDRVPLGFGDYDNLEENYAVSKSWEIVANTPNVEEYGFFDVDRDGHKELVMKTGTCEADYQYEFIKVDYNSMNDFDWLGSIDAFHSVLLDDKGNLIKESASMGSQTFSRIEYSNGKLKETVIAEYETGEDGDYVDLGYKSVYLCTEDIYLHY